jgi:hypothetical protein
LFILGCGNEKGDSRAFKHLSEPRLVGHACHGRTVELVPRKSESVLDEVLELAPQWGLCPQCRFWRKAAVRITLSA